MKSQNETGLHSQTTTKVGLAAAAALAVLLAGCVPVPSLRPLFTEEESLYEAKLLGEWRAAPEAGDLTLYFQRSGEKSYRLAYERGDNVSFYDARVGRVGDYLFLDVTLGEANAEHCLPQGAYPHFLPLHTFYRIEVNDGQLRLSFLNHEWVRKGIARGKISVPHASLEELVFLTAAPEELQKLVLRHAGDKEAFTAFGPFYRSPDEYSIGQYMMLAEFQAAYAGEFYNINAFDQPGVQLGKDLTYAPLDREGFHAERKRIADYRKEKKRLSGE